MRHADLPDTPLASYSPAPAADTLRGFLRETFARFKGNVPLTVQAFHALCFSLIDAALDEAGGDPIATRGSSGTGAEMVRLLQTMSRDTDHRVAMRAYAYLRLAGHEGRSFQQIGDELGVRRATVHKCYRDIQRRLGDFPGRGDKSPAARETFRRRRTGRRRQRFTWPGQNAWQNRSTFLAVA